MSTVPPKQSPPTKAPSEGMSDATAADSAKRIELLRQRLEQYNAAIAQAMGMTQQPQHQQQHTSHGAGSANAFSGAAYYDQNVRTHFEHEDNDEDNDDDFDDEEYDETDDTEEEDERHEHGGAFDSDAAAYYAERVLRQHLQRQHHQQEAAQEARAQQLRTQQFTQQFNSNNVSAEFEEEEDDEDDSSDAEYYSKSQPSNGPQSHHNHHNVNAAANNVPTAATASAAAANVVRNAQTAAAALASSHEFTELLKKWSPYSWQQQHQATSVPTSIPAPTTTSRPLFPPDTYRENSEPQNANAQKRNGPPTSAAAAVPPVPSPANGLTTAGASSTTVPKTAPAPEVDRCLSEELKATPADTTTNKVQHPSGTSPTAGNTTALLASDDPLQSNPPLRATVNEFTDKSVTQSDSATAGATASPIPEAPDYTLSDLENAFHRINAVEQSLHLMKGFPLQDAKLPFEDRIAALRATRVGLMERDAEAHKASLEIKKHLQPLSSKDESLHSDIQTLLASCAENFDENFKNVFGMQKFVSDKETRLEKKAGEMQRHYADLQERRRQVEAIEDHNKRLTELCESRRKIILKEKEDVKSLHEKLKDKEKEVQEAESKSSAWLQMLQDRDNFISAREERLAKMELQLEKRLSSIQAQKENRGHMGVNLGSGLYNGGVTHNGKHPMGSSSAAASYPNAAPPPPPPQLPTSAFEQQYQGYSNYYRDAPKFRSD